jgi:hypothetical protein
MIIINSTFQPALHLLLSQLRQVLDVEVVLVEHSDRSFLKRTNLNCVAAHHHRRALQAQRRRLLLVELDVAVPPRLPALVPHQLQRKNLPEPLVALLQIFYLGFRGD